MESGYQPIVVSVNGIASLVGAYLAVQLLIGEATGCALHLVIQYLLVSKKDIKVLKWRASRRILALDKPL